MADDLWPSLGLVVSSCQGLREGDALLRASVVLYPISLLPFNGQVSDQCSTNQPIASQALLSRRQPLLPALGFRLP